MGATSISLSPGQVPSQFSLDSIIQSVSYLQLEMNPGSAMGEISRLSFQEDHILTLDFDHNLLMLFDRKGKHLGQVGRIGRGPGEYAEFTDAAFNSARGTIDVLSNVPKKIIRYDQTSLHYQSECSLPDGPFFSAFFPYQNQYLLTIDLFDPGFEDFAYHFLRLHAETGKVQARHLPFRAFERKETFSLFRLKQGFYPIDASLSAYHWGSKTIYSFLQDSFRPTYSFDFGAFPFVTDRLLDSEARAELKEAGKESCCLNPLFETPNFIFGSYYFGQGRGEHFLYSKPSTHLIQFSDESVINPFNGCPLWAIQSYDGDYLVSAVDPDLLVYTYEQEKANLLPQASTQLAEFLSTLDMEGNQVLIFYQLRPF